MSEEEEEHIDPIQKAKNDAVFNDELLPHADALHTFAYHHSYNEVDASDLVQETYLKAYRFIDKYTPGSNAKAWLFKILRNSYINQHRKKSRKPKQVDYEEMVTYHDSDSAKGLGYVDMREEIFGQEMGDEVSIALESLPEDFKTVIILCDIEDFSYEEISKIVEIPIGTVRSRLFRARNALKEKLAKYATEKGYEDKRGQARKLRKNGEEE